MSSPSTGPLCPSTGLIVAVIRGRGCVACLCLLAHFNKMFPLGVSWWGLFFLFSLLRGSSLFWGVSCYIFFLLDWGSDRGICLTFSQIIRVSIGCQLQIFVNVLPSNSLLLYLEIILENTTFQLLSLYIESLGNFLRLHAQSRYFSTFIVKLLTRKPDLGHCDLFTIAIHHPIFRSKSVQALKKDVKLQGLVAEGKILRLK